MKKVLLIFVLTFASFSFASAQIVTSTNLDIQRQHVETKKSTEDLVSFNFYIINSSCGDIGLESMIDFPVNMEFSYHKIYVIHKESETYALIYGYGLDAIYRSIALEYGGEKFGTLNYLGADARAMAGVRFSAAKEVNGDLYLSFIAGGDTPLSKDLYDGGGNAMVGFGFGYNQNIRKLTLGLEYFQNFLMDSGYPLPLSGIMFRVGYKL